MRKFKAPIEVYKTKAFDTCVRLPKEELQKVLDKMEEGCYWEFSYDWGGCYYEGDFPDIRIKVMEENK